MAKIATLVEIAKTAFKKIQGAPDKSLLAQVKDIGGTENEMEVYSVQGIQGNPIKGTHGVKVNLGGLQVVIATHNYKLQQALEDGETYIYAMDTDGNILGSILLNADEEIVFNDGEDYAVAFNDLKTEFNKLKDDFNDLVSKYNAHIHTTTATIGSSTTVGVISATTSQDSQNTSNIDNAKVEKVRLP